MGKLISIGAVGWVYFISTLVGVVAHLAFGAAVEKQSHPKSDKYLSYLDSDNLYERAAGTAA